MMEINMTTDENGTRTISRANNVRAYRILNAGEVFIVKGGRLDESASKWNYICEYYTVASATAHVLEVLGWA